MGARTAVLSLLHAPPFFFLPHLGSWALVGPAIVTCKNCRCPHLCVQECNLGVPSWINTGDVESRGLCRRPCLGILVPTEELGAFYVSAESKRSLREKNL